MGQRVIDDLSDLPLALLFLGHACLCVNCRVLGDTIPQTVACQLGVLLALNFFLRLWFASFAVRQPPHFCHKSLLIFTFTNCVISLRPLLSSKSFKTDSNYKHSWTVPFLSWSLNIVFSSKTTVINISILGLCLFWLNRVILGIFIFLKEILKFWSVDGFIIFDNISLLLLVLANIQNFDADLRKSYY